MSLLRRALVPLVAALPATLLAGIPTAAAAPDPGSVYVLSNQSDGNAVIVYDRGADGALHLADSFATGGLGTGGGLGSQGAIVVDDAGRHVYAVNAGSDSISSFEVDGDGLELVSTVASGGERPTSLTVEGDTLYVLNAGGDGNIAGFHVDGGALSALPGSARALSGTATAPAQVSFTPDGDHLVVAERATNTLDVFAVDGAGYASGPVTSVSAGVTPFGFDVDNKGHVIVSEAAGGATDASSVSSYELDGSALEVISAAVPTTETAACWIATTNDGRFAFAGNAGSRSISGYRVAPDGELALVTPDGKTASASGGVTDLAVSRDSRFLYARLGNGFVGAYRINADGSLQPLAEAAGLPAGAAGIAAT